MVKPTSFPLVLALVLSPGCAAVHELDSYFVEQNRKSTGQTCVVKPAHVTCARKERPYVSVQHNALEPQRVAAGKEITHTFRYALCTESMEADSTIKGELVRSIIHKGKVVRRDVTHDYELHPGVWEDAVAVAIEPRADPGFYTIKVEFQAEKLAFEQAATVEVFRDAQLSDDAGSSSLTGPPAGEPGGR